MRRRRQFEHQLEEHPEEFETDFGFCGSDEIEFPYAYSTFEDPKAVQGARTRVVADLRGCGEWMFH